jgi:hypothetical protein
MKPKKQMTRFISIQELLDLCKNGSVNANSRWGKPILEDSITDIDIKDDQKYIFTFTHEEYPHRYEYLVKVIFHQDTPVLGTGLAQYHFHDPMQTVPEWVNTTVAYPEAYLASYSWDNVESISALSEWAIWETILSPEVDILWWEPEGIYPQQELDNWVDAPHPDSKMIYDIGNLLLRNAPVADWIANFK